MPTTATAPTSKVKATVKVLHEQPSGFEPCDGQNVRIGDAIYDPNTGVHVVLSMVDPPYRMPFRRARGDGWQNAIFDDHTYIVRHDAARTDRSQP